MSGGVAVGAYLCDAVSFHDVDGAADERARCGGVGKREGDRGEVLTDAAFAPVLVDAEHGDVASV